MASGAARIEEGIVDGFGRQNIEMTLTDINPTLLATAANRLADKAEVRSLVTNVNQLSLPRDSFDVIICVSALHHMVELEHIMAESAAALADDGEFWSVGEYIGRNGNRLFDDAYAIANPFFLQLPEKYRVNRNPGSPGYVDVWLPNSDCSVVGFEGIRSEEIDTVMARSFLPIDVIRYDCFLWRTVQPGLPGQL